MLSNISWTQYSITLVIFLVIYYSYVGWAYYRTIIFQSITRSSSPALTPHELPVAGQALTAFLAQAGQQKLSKEEIKYGLHQILAKYPSIRKEEYKASVIKLVQADCQQYCAVCLEKEEISQLWMDQDNSEPFPSLPVRRDGNQREI